MYLKQSITQQVKLQHTLQLLACTLPEVIVTIQNYLPCKGMGVRTNGEG